MELKTINVKLPLVGNTKIHFYRDSCIFWQFSDDKEMSRLNRIPHLGISSTAFTGANHSRLEYTLLQCAIIELVSKFHKDSSNVALSGKVKLNGLKTKASSGEDLLKLWALLGAYGHTQWTFGTERILLQLAYENNNIKNWVMNRIRNRELRKWCKNVINDYLDESFHYVLAIKRIYLENPYDRNKTKLIHYLRNLLLPIKELFKKDLTARFKIYSLRKIYERIRLISIIVLDSHYSHYPINIQLNSILTDSSFIKPTKYEIRDFPRQIKTLIGWLANELHFNPKATALQRLYEIDNNTRLKKMIENANDKINEIAVIKEIFNKGLGKPKNNQIVPLYRATFNNNNNFFGHSNKYELQKKIETIIDNKNILVSVEYNYFQENIIIDIHYNSEAKLSTVGSALLAFRTWLIKQIKIDIKRVTKIFRKLSGKSFKILRDRELKNRIDSLSYLFENLFYCIIKLLIPENWNFIISDYIPNDANSSPILFKYKMDNDVITDNLTPLLQKIVNHNPYNFDQDRLQEIKGLKRIVDYSRAQLTIACPEKFTLTGNHGQDKDDWDGIIIKIDDNYIRVIIIEAKNVSGSDNKREKEAFNQLEETIDILSRKFNPKYRRKRIKGLGARLIIKMTE